MTTQNINMDLVPGGSSKVIRVSQYDHESRTYKITLTHNNKNDFTIPDGVTVEVRGTKPSGKSFVYPCTFEGNVVTLVIKDQMTAEYGTVKAEIVLVKGATRLGAGNFDIIVEKASFTPGNVINSDTFDSLVEDAVVKCANDKLIELYVDVELNAESDAPVGNKVICNNFANAIKGYASGSTVTVDDVSPVEHNPSIWVHGKNHFNYERMDFENRDSALVDNGNNSITVNTTSGSSAVSTKATLRRLAPTLKIGELYTLSFNSNGTDKYIYLSESQSGWNNRMTRRITEADLASTVFLYASGVSTTAIISNIQIEKGTIATEYAPHIDPTTVRVTDADGETYTPNDDGIVEGIPLTALTNGISVNNEGVVIDCEYNRDSTKVIEKLTNAIIALGGGV